MNTPISTTFPRQSFVSDSSLSIIPEREMIFDNQTQLLDYVTRNWREDFVTTELTTRAALETFRTRPFFMVLSVDAPILTRYRRSVRYDFIAVLSVILDIHSALAPGSSTAVSRSKISYKNMTVISTEPSLQTVLKG